MPVLPPVVDDVASLDPVLGARLKDDLSRLTEAAGAVAWGNRRIPALIDAASSGPTELLSLLVDEVKALTGVPTCWALAWSGDPEDETVTFRALAGDGGGLGAAGLTTPSEISRSIVGQVLREGRATWSDDARSDARFRASESVHLYALRSIGCLPVGERGVLYLLHPEEPGAFSRSQRLQITALCVLAGSFLDSLGVTDALDPYAAAEARREKRRARSQSLPGLVGTARPMLDLFAAVRAFAPMPWPALILGETGTGKEAVARALHSTSPRKDLPFVPVNCAAIPENLAESMLFGHVKGAFTGADAPSDGTIASVQGGTLFLDEVGELPAAVQPKLLRLLQEGTWVKVGGTKVERFEGRIVAATHRALDRGEGRQGFREDLFHRLGGCLLRVPALGDRREDIPAIATYLFQRALDQAGATDLSLDPAVLPRLQRMTWPGNVRQLENMLRSAIARTLAARKTVVDGAMLGLPDFGDAVFLTTTGTAGAVKAPPVSVEELTERVATLKDETVELADDLRAATEAFQRAQVREALRRADGNRTAAAELLGVSRQWLHRLITKWDGEP